LDTVAVQNRRGSGLVDALVFQVPAVQFFVVYVMTMLYTRGPKRFSFKRWNLSQETRHASLCHVVRRIIIIFRTTIPKPNCNAKHAVRCAVLARRAILINSGAVKLSNSKNSLVLRSTGPRRG
jgi:hypothetical protein